MNNDVAFLTTIFPMKREYLYDFFNSLTHQTYKKFDLIVVNDGYENFDEIKREFCSFPIIELKYSSTPAKNREYGINYIKDNNYGILVFGDSDDYFEENRIEKSIELLSSFDIVVNDVSLVNGNGIYSEKYFSNRIKNNFEIYLNFIYKKNLFGLSNTSINVQILENICFEKNLIAVDWYLYTVLLLRKFRAIFTNDTVTFYRQYLGNTIGLNHLSNEQMEKGILVKIKHYDLLKNENEVLNALSKKMHIFKKNYENCVIPPTLPKVKNPFWWEEVQLYEE